MTRKILWILMAILAVVIGLYPSLYFLIHEKFGLLRSKPDWLLANTLWNFGFYTHIIGGGIALLAGWSQFSNRLRNKCPGLHRQLGKIYIVSVLASALAGIGIAFYSNAGIMASLGFMLLGIIWFSVTLAAYVQIRNRQVEKHQQLMIYSYAACFAAVTLRLWLPLLGMLFENFNTAYTLVAWLCWVPNLLVAFFIAQRILRPATAS